MPAIFRSIVLTAFVVAAGVGAPAQAQTDAATFEMRGLRTDVRELCPDAAADLQAALWRAVYDHGVPATMDVRFELQGSRVGTVTVGDGPSVYRGKLRRAVGGLLCDSRDTKAYTVSFRVQFVESRSDPLGGGAVALLSAP